MSKKIALVAIVIVTVLVLLLLITVPYIPTVENYTDQEVFERPAHYQVTSATQGDGIDWFGKWAYHWAKVNIQNQETSGGDFSVYFYVASGELTGAKTVSHFIGGTQTAEFYADWDTALFQGMDVKYTVTPPTIQDIKFVEKTRTVFKSLLQIWFGA